MYPFIAKLVEIFKVKKKNYEELKEILLELKKAIKDNNFGVLYTDEGQQLVAKHRLFHEDTGLLPLVKVLMRANDELVHYQDEGDKTSIRDEFGINMSRNLAQCGEAVHSNYRQMMRWVEKEQYLMERWFKPILEEIANREDYREAWKESLKDFGNFMVVYHLDLNSFYGLLDVLKERGFLQKRDEKPAGQIQIQQEPLRPEPTSQDYATQVNPAVLGRHLADQADDLSIIGSVAAQIGAPPDIIREAGVQKERVEQAIDAVEIVYPEIQKRKKSKGLRLRARFRLMRRKLRRRYSSRNDVVVYGLQTLRGSSLTRVKLLNLLLSRLNSESQRLDEVAQKAAKTALKTPGVLDLKPARIGLRRVWVLSRSKTGGAIKTKIDDARQLIKEADNIASRLSASIKNIRARIQKSTMEQTASALKRARDSRKTLVELMSQISSSRAPRKLIVTAALVPLLVGAFPSKITSTVLKLKSDVQIARQILGDEFSEQQIQGIVRSSSFVDGLIKILDDHKSGAIPYNELPDYIREMISDGVLDIAILVGAEWEHSVPIYKDDIRTIKLGQRHIVLRLRYIDKIKDAIKAFEESDFIHVTSHSRYGLGWALAGEGMENPMRMQTHPVKILKSDIKGYRGRILKDLGNGYVIVQPPGDQDIKSIKPKRGYQLISTDSCNSGPYFLETLKRMREGLPTTIIYATTEVYSLVTKIVLNDLFELKDVEEITQDLNAHEGFGRELKRDPYEMVVLNADAGTPESTNYVGNNIPNSITFFYDVKVVDK